MIKAGTKKIIPYSERLMPTTTARASRLQIFQPTRSPQRCTRSIETPYGTGEIMGRLGQMHALLIEAIFFHAERMARLDNHGLAILIDPHHIRASMSAGGRYSGAGINGLVADLASAIIRVEVTGYSLLSVDTILDRLVPSPSATKRHPITGEQRPLMVAHISPTWAAWVANDPIPLHYDPQPLAGLRNGISMAIARLVLTHQSSPNGGWKIDTLIHGVGADAKGTAGQNRRREIRQDHAALAALGVMVSSDGDRVHKHTMVPQHHDEARGRVLDAR